MILSDPPVYLDLGGALAAFGLIFAVYQLRKPKWELILRIRRRWQSNLFWIFGGIGLFLVLVRVLLPQEWLQCFPFLFGNPLSYEVAAYLFFIASPVSLLYFSTKSKVMNSLLVIYSQFQGLSINFSTNSRIIAGL